jgi:hypothetical protein
VGASGAAAASREFQIGRFSPNVNIDLNVALRAQADLMMIAPTYTFATPVLGGQLSATLASVYGRISTNLAGTLTTGAGPIVTTRNGFLEDALVSYGDLYPTLKLKWNNGVHSYMVYGTGADRPARCDRRSGLAAVQPRHPERNAAFVGARVCGENATSAVIARAPVSRGPVRMLHFTVLTFQLSSSLG